MSASDKQQPTMYMGDRGEEVGRKWLDEHAALLGYGPDLPVVLFDHEVARGPASGDSSGKRSRVYLTKVYAKKRLPEQQKTTAAIAKGSLGNGDDQSEKKPERDIPSAHQGEKDSSTDFVTKVPSYLRPPEGLSFATTHAQGFEELCSRMEGLGPADYNNSILTKFNEVSQPSDVEASMVTEWYSTVPVSSSDQVPSH
jgi:hypothetical protein